ncbi:MAG: UDP-N-acetylglucosamine 1-carboxyvinyltransferase, partial [Eubacterium aggregans]
VLMSIAQGNSIINESIFESRFKYVDELRKMGANITVNGRVASITGVLELSGTRIAATDLRAGVAMVLAGLIANGETQISDIHYIERGYESLEENIRSLGGKIRRVTVENKEE